ncbi:MAG: YncE family protein [Rhizobacter sp.]|nr:YncE family protein [Ferruginibacter sp.]
MKKNLYKWLLPAVLLMQACSKDDVPVNPVTPPAKGLYAISEGGSTPNSAKLGFYNLGSSTFTGDYFVQQNPSETALGSTSNDAIIYGGKLYIVMNISSEVLVLNAYTGALIKRINFGTTPNFKFPRYAVGTRGKVYVSAYDNTVNIIDTSALTLGAAIPVGKDPEGLAVQGNYLYVANSGGLDYPNVDSTVSVIDLNTNAEIKKIKVGYNPNKVEVASNGDVYVSAYGVGFPTPPAPIIPASVSVINSTSNTLKTTLGGAYQYSHVRIFGNIAYFFNNYGGAGTARVYNTDTNADIRAEFITDGTTITTPYGINIDEQNGDVYIMDAKDYVTAGAVTCFDKNGKKKFTFSVAPGVSPNKVLFNR